MTLSAHRPKYEAALAVAQTMLACFDDLEPTSALKQSAADLGIPYGDEMGAFIDWAGERL